MDNVKIKFLNLQKALASLHETLAYFEKIKKITNKQHLLDDYDIVYKISRDSVIQRFEYTIELFWKFLRLYLEQVKQAHVETNTPSDVIRTACHTRIIDEEDSRMCIRMIKSRNLTSHIYKDEFAEQLAQDIPQYYQFMTKISSTIQPKNI